MSPVHSFKSLPEDLGTRCVNHIQLADDLPPFINLTTATPLQRRAFELVQVPDHFDYM